MNTALNQSQHRAPPSPDGVVPPLSRADLDAYQRRARKLRAAAFAAAIGAAGRALGRGYRALRAGVSRARDRRRALAELARLNDRTLRDIGIQRAQIPYLVEQMLAARAAAEADRGVGRPVRPLALAAPARTPRSPADDECCPPLAA